MSTTVPTIGPLTQATFSCKSSSCESTQSWAVVLLRTITTAWNVFTRNLNYHISHKISYIDLLFLELI